MFRSIKRLWCKHPQWINPIVPFMGPAPWKYCTECDHQQTMEPADYKEGANVLFETVDATIVEMTPGSRQ